MARGLVLGFWFLALGLAHAPVPERPEVYTPLARLFVVDNASPEAAQVLALDLPEGKVVARLGLPPRVMSLGALPSGRYLVATRGRDTDRQWVSVIYTGKEEGGWRRPVVAKSLLLGRGMGGFEGQSLAQLWGLPFLVAKREGVLFRFPEEALAPNAPFQAETLSLGQPDHYHFLELDGERVAVGYLRQGRVRVLDRKGQVLGEAACPVLHGEAHHGDRIFWACARDVLVMDHRGQEVQRLAYPLKERIGAFLKGQGAYFGYSDRVTHLQRLDPAGPSLTPIPLGGHLVRAKGYGEVLLVLLEEGILQVRSGEDGRLLRQVRVDRGFPEMDEDVGGAILPDIARLEERAYVSLPHRGLVAEVDWKGGRLLRYLRTGGMPTRMVLLR